MLDAAYQQLLKYRENLGNPPLLIQALAAHGATSGSGRLVSQ
jgi:hypothetical protein